MRFSFYTLLEKKKKAHKTDKNITLEKEHFKPYQNTPWFQASLPPFCLNNALIYTVGFIAFKSYTF